MGEKGMKRPSLPLIIFLVFCVLYVVPLYFMIYGALIPEIGATNVSLKYIMAAFTSPDLPGVLLNTAEYGFGCGLLSVAIATPLAWLVARTDVPGGGILGTLSILRLSVPLIVEAFSWIFIFSPQIGLANIYMERLFGLTSPIFNIYSIWGLILAAGVGGIPFSYLVLEPAFRNVDPSLEEVSRTTGASIVRTFFKVTLPAIVPAILSVYLIGVIFGFENFDYPLILGQPAHIVTMATLVFNLGELDQNAQAAGFSIIYIVMTLILLSIYIWITRKSFRYVTVTGTSTHRTPIRLGRWKWPALLYIIAVFFIAFGLPIVVIFLVSVQPFYQVVSNPNIFGAFTLAHYVQALKTPFFQSSVINSFVLTIGAAAGTTVLGGIMSYVLVKGRERGQTILYFLSHLPLGFSSVVYSIALIWTFLVIPGLNSIIYGTIWAMLIGLMVVWSPYSIRIVAPALAQLANELEESAAICGAGWARRFRQITLPLLKSAIVNSFNYVMFNSFRELGPIFLLYSSQSIVLIILLEQLYSAGADFPTVAAMSMMLIGMLVGSLIVIRLLGRTRYQRLRA